MKEQAGNVSIPYYLIAKLHGLRAKIGLKTGKAPSVKTLVIDAINKHIKELE